MLGSNYFQVNKTRDQRTITDQSKGISEPDLHEKGKNESWTDSSCQQSVNP